MVLRTLLCIVLLALPVGPLAAQSLRQKVLSLFRFGDSGA